MKNINPDKLYKGSPEPTWLPIHGEICNTDYSKNSVDKIVLQTRCNMPDQDGVCAPAPLAPQKLLPEGHDRR